MTMGSIVSFVPIDVTPMPRLVEGRGKRDEIPIAMRLDRSDATNLAGKLTCYHGNFEASSPNFGDPVRKSHFGWDVAHFRITR